MMSKSMEKIKVVNSTLRNQTMMSKSMEKIKVVNSTPGSRTQFLQCGKCPVEDYCHRQTAATCPLVKIVEKA